MLRDLKTSSLTFPKINPGLRFWLVSYRFLVLCLKAFTFFLGFPLYFKTSAVESRSSLTTVRIPVLPKSTFSSRKPCSSVSSHSIFITWDKPTDFGSVLEEHQEWADLWLWSYKLASVLTPNRGAERKAPTREIAQCFVGWFWFLLLPLDFLALTFSI